MANLVLSCVYGSNHVPFVHTFLYSVTNASPESQIFIGYCDFPEIERKLLQVAYPTVNFVNQAVADVPTSSHAGQASKKTKLWLELLENHVSIGDNALFMDIDTIMIDSPFKSFHEIQDLALTRKLGKWPLNSGVIFVKKSLATVDFFQHWHESTQKILGSRLHNRESELSGGGADQFSILQLLDIQESIKDTNIHKIFVSRFDLTVSFLSCDEFNQTESVPLAENVKIIHYKAGWHKILLANSKFTRNRPATTSRELCNLWQGLYLKSKSHLYRSINESAWEDYETVMAVKNIPYEPRGMYNSELALICAMMKILGLNVVLESGRARGHSTYILSVFFNNDPNAKIISVDFEKNSDTAFSEKRLSSFPNTVLAYGHANSLLNELITNEIPKSSDYVVLLDGPKSLNALFLLGRLIRNKRPPVLAFIHDMRRYESGDKPSFQRFLCQTLFDRVFFSDDFPISPSVVSCDESVFSQDSKSHFMRNEPFMKNLLPTGSYGPTLAVILPTQRDFDVRPRLLLWPLINLANSWKEISLFLTRGLLFRLGIARRKKYLQ
jgi:hypothetical protein